MKRTTKHSGYGKGFYGRKNTTVFVTMELGRYFSATVEVRSGGHCVGGGADHKLIRRLQPSAGRLLKWHLVDADGTPMHYIENSVYWAGCVAAWCDGKPDSPPNWDALLRTTIWGAAPGDDELLNELRRAFDERNAHALKAILRYRLPALQNAFHDAMRELFGDEYPS